LQKTFESSSHKRDFFCYFQAVFHFVFLLPHKANERKSFLIRCFIGWIFPQAIIGYFCFTIGFSYRRIEVGSQSVNRCA